MSWFRNGPRGFLLLLLAVVTVACVVPEAKKSPAEPRLSVAWAPGGAALSIFEASREGCAWRQVELPLLRSRTLVLLPGRSCRGSRLALSADQKHAALWFDPSAAHEGLLAGPDEMSGRDRLFVVEEGREPHPVSLPPDLADLGFDSRGRLVALTLQLLTEREIARGEALVDGNPVKLVPATDGIPVLAHAFALEGSGWKRFETVNSTTGWDLARRTGALEAAADLGFRSPEVLLPFIQGDDENDPAILGHLDRFAPQVHPVAGENQWIRFGSGSTWFEVWEQSGEFAFATGLAAFLDAQREPVKPESWPFTEKDVLSYSWRGPFLLARIAGEGTRPRLYQNGRLLWISDRAAAVTFWPERRSTESRP